MSEEAYPDALPVGHRLHWYGLEHVLGQGGFGITYLARDTNLDRRVAIKEYLPGDYARRRPDTTVWPRTESHAERYAWGLERFALEARTLARFDHPSIVRVHSVFEANNTAYMVMRFEEGENLATLLDRVGTLPESAVLNSLLTILDGLQLVHDAGFIHRDIKPENIYVRKDGTPVLLDFGSARQSLGRAKTMTILVAPGYAPLEQYYGDAATQGPWTDIYGLGATCYRAIAGRAPLDAIARAKGVLGSAREMLELAVDAGRGRYGERLLAAVDHAMRLSERDRPQSIAEWRREIVAAPAPAVVSPGAVAPAPPAAPPPSAALSTPGSLPLAGDSPEARAVPPARRPALTWGALAGASALAASAVMVLPVWRNTSTPVTMAQPVAPAPSAVASGAGAGAPAAPAQAVTRMPVETHVVAPGNADSAAIASPTPPTQTSPPTEIAMNRRGPPAPGGAGTKHVQTVSPDLGVMNMKPVPPVSKESTPPPMAAASVPLDTGPLPSAAVAVAPTLPVTLTTPAPAVIPSVAMQTGSRDGGTAHRARDEQLDAADAALRRGEHAAAAEILAPLARAGVFRAQAMLGRAYEGTSGPNADYFQAYVWYSVAARNGEPSASALRDKVAGKLQPAEIQQAGRLVETLK